MNQSSGRRAALALACSLLMSACIAPHGPKTDPRPGSIPLAASSPEIRVADLEAHVAALTDPRTEGRGTGTPGEAVAADWLARAFAAAGLAPAGDDGGWTQAFDFTAGVSLGDGNRLIVNGREAALDEQWRPLAFSREGAFSAAEVVFAGYGLVAPASDGQAAHDDFDALDVRNRWVLVFRDLPQDLDTERRRQLRRYAGLRYKAMLARDRGARGVLFVSGPLGRFRETLAPLRFDASLAGTSIAAITIDDDLAASLVAGSGRSLSDWQDAAGDTIAEASGRTVATPLPAARVEGEIDLRTERRTVDWSWATPRAHSRS